MYSGMAPATEMFLKVIVSTLQMTQIDFEFWFALNINDNAGFDRRKTHRFDLACKYLHGITKESSICGRI